MKKIFVITLALLLAVPALSFAGSATSRFDMTIGGAVNFNFGYVTKNIANDSIHGSARESSASATLIGSEHGNFRYSAQDSAINFLSRGPEAFGAKTMGFLQIDFRGANTSNYFGGAQLQYGYVRLDWANSYLIMGKALPEVIDLYSRAFIIAGDHTSTSGIGGGRHIQIAYRHNINKNFNFMLGFINHTAQDGSTGNVNAYGRSSLPAGMMEFAFQSDSCGKVGPNNLKIAIGAIGGREKKTSNTSATTVNNLEQQNVDMWLAGLRTIVPIIPEKKGNKAMGLYFSGLVYIGQNAWPYLGTPAPAPGSYWRGTAYSNGFANDAASPTLYGGMAQLTFYLTDTTFVNAQYGVIKMNYSEFARTVPAITTAVSSDTDWKGVDRLNQVRVYSASIFHDASASTRFALQWLRHYTNYNGFGGTGTVRASSGNVNLENYGVIDKFTAMAMYFF